ncbi:MAG: flagellin [Ilumatobacter sp.]|uniref:flagellin N-terminal helical domain-containing protein n=1 Tax=Ilumatobacter sp. TaxID=1967498 RepID=UPI003919DCA7
MEVREMRINQNSMAINAYRNLSTNNMSLGKSLEKLSSGFRINRAADDAAGLVISQNLRSQVSGLRQATRNAQDGISVVQTAEGALNEVHTILGRMRDLSVQAANTGTNDADARNAAQAEINALTAEVNRISDKTAFGGQNLLDGSYGKTAGTLSAFDADGSITVAVADTIDVAVTGGSGTVSVALSAGTFTGANAAASIESAIKSALVGTGNAVDAAAANNLSVSFEAIGAGGAFTVSNGSAAAITIADGTGTPLADNTLAGLAGAVGAATGTGGTFQIGANSGDTVTVGIADMDATTLGVGALDVTSEAGSAAAITALDTAIQTVSTTRGDLGALQNRFESMINNLQVTTENLVASESRIRDTDMAAEMTNFTKSQILSQASTAMLAQANQVPQSVLSLLR